MSTDGKVLYEYPFNERVRTLLRLEDLFDKLLYFCAQEHSYCHHTALLTLFEILEVTSRADLKSDLLQELERHKQSLHALRNNPQVSETALSGVLSEIEQAQQNLNATTGKAGQHVRDNEWLMSIRSRAIIPVKHQGVSRQLSVVACCRSFHSAGHAIVLVACGGD